MAGWTIVNSIEHGVVIADTYINPGSPPGSPDSIRFLIDNDNDDTNRVFLIEHDGGGTGNDLLTVDEGATVYLRGAIERAGTVGIRNQMVGATIARFTVAGVEVASIEGSGKGVFTTGCVRMKVVGASPDGAISGQAGDLLIWNDSGTRKLMVCAGGTTWAAT